MLVSCNACGRYHNRGELCPLRGPRSGPKEESYITRFRSSRAWQKQREYIRNRDKQLCQLCLQNGKYTFSRLQVHHIETIKRAWTKRLDENNLVTLCPACHNLAENGIIKAGELKDIVKNAGAF